MKTNKAISTALLYVLLVALGVAIATLFVSLKNDYDFHQRCDGVVVTKSWQSKNYCIPTSIFESVVSK